MNPGYCKISIRGLRIETKINDVFEIFQDFGTITECRLIISAKSSNRNESKGYCFISYSTPEEAQTAMQAMNGKRFDGSTIQISYATEQMDIPFNDPEIRNVNIPESHPEGRPMPSESNWERHYIHDYEISMKERNQYQRHLGNISPHPMNPSPYYDQQEQQWPTNMDHESNSPMYIPSSMNGFPPPPPPPPQFLSGYNETNDNDYQSQSQYQSHNSYQPFNLSRRNPSRVPPMNGYFEPDDRPLYEPNDRPLYEPDDRPLYDPNDRPLYDQNDRPLYDPNLIPSRSPGKRSDYFD